MSFDLDVISPVDLPSDLGAKICSQLRQCGVEVEIHPSFEVSTWQGGFLPMKVLAMPHRYIGSPLQAPALSGFEVAFSPKQASFRSPACRTTTEFSLLSLTAGAIAKITGGRLEIPGESLPPSTKGPMDEAIELLMRFVAESSAEDQRQSPFEKWID